MTTNDRRTSAASEIAAAAVREASDLGSRLLAQSLDAIAQAGSMLIDTLGTGHKVFFFGNGGSAAEAQHLAAELVGRFREERRGWPAIALTTDTSALTAVGNDYGFEQLFARQVEALAAGGDLAIALSTSGNSPNVLAGAVTARDRGCRVVGLTGASGGKLAALCDVVVTVPSETTARIQEAHLLIGHVWCEMVDSALARPKSP
jgi:D-sedoheptulose 7-phosphate isomerase